MLIRLNFERLVLGKEKGKTEKRRGGEERKRGDLVKVFITPFRKKVHLSRVHQALRRELALQKIKNIWNRPSISCKIDDFLT